MSFWILFKDELYGFLKSKVMWVLLFGLPLMSSFFFLLSPDTDGIPIVIFVGLMATSVSSTLAGVMLATTIVNERSKHVYDLFLIRPVKRSHLILSKLAAVYGCLVLAVFLSLGVGLGVDMIRNGLPDLYILEAVWESVAMSMASMAIACCMGVLIGLIVDSVMVAAILSIYLGNQFAVAASLPGIFFEEINSIVFSAIIGIGISGILLIAILKIFQKKSL